MTRKPVQVTDLSPLVEKLRVINQRLDLIDVALAAHSRYMGRVETIFQRHIKEKHR